MTVNVSLADLSFESNEVLALEIDPTGAFAGVPSDIADSIELEHAERLLDVYSTIIHRKSICRSDIENIAELAPSYPSLEKLLKKYPINSFSVESSRTNYDVSCENFVKTSYEAVVRALKAILKFFVDNFKRLWKFITQNAQRSAAVDDLDSKLVGIQQYILEVSKVLGESSVGPAFQKVQSGIFESERHNVSKSWNEFRNFVITQPDSAYDMIETLSGVLKVSIPPFAEAVDAFLTELSNSVTEQDIRVAVTRMSLHSQANGNLIALAAKFGYRPAQMKIASNMTPFHANALFIKSVFRSWSNHRQEISADVFAKAVVGLQVSKWGEVVAETIRVSGQRTERLITRIESFNEQSLKPGLEDIYAEELMPFFKALLSIVQGYTLLEGCLGELTAVRDNAVITLSKASLNVAKGIDAFARKNHEQITIGGRALLATRRKALVAAMG